MLLLIVVHVMEKVLVKFISTVLTVLETSPDLLSARTPVVAPVLTLRMLESNAELSVRINFSLLLMNVTNIAIPM
jgi:hypothetical protein